MSKACERCGSPIPDDFQNLLCVDCYNIISDEHMNRVAEGIEETKKAPTSAINPANIPPAEPVSAKIRPPEAQNLTKEEGSSGFGIKDPSYQENPEQEDKSKIFKFWEINNLASMVDNNSNNSCFNILCPISESSSPVPITSSDFKSICLAIFDSQDITTTSGTQSSINLEPIFHEVGRHYQFSESTDNSSIEMFIEAAATMKGISTKGATIFTIPASRFELLTTPGTDSFNSNLFSHIHIAYYRAIQSNSQLKLIPYKNKLGISDPNYIENEEAEDKEQILANLAQFIYSHDPGKKRPGKLLWYPTRNMYTYIKNYCIQKVTSHPQYPKYIWKPKIVDVGCGSGVGSNVMSQEADFVWGIDKNLWSIEFAKEAFTREKNGIYYNPQVSFDVIDIMNENRTLMQFDLVVCVEIIEHIYDTNLFLKEIIRHFTKKDKKGRRIDEGGTEFFISTPNRAFKRRRKDKPENIFHVREWTADEYVEMLLKYFENVETMDTTGKVIDWHNNEADEIIFAKCTKPKI